MSPSLIRTLRASRAALKLESRSQAPLCLGAVACAALLVGGFRLAGEVRPGELGRVVPYLALGLATLVAAFAAADAWTRDSYSGLDGLLRGAPWRSRWAVVPRISCALCVAAVVALVFDRLEPVVNEDWSQAWSKTRGANAVLATVVFAALAAFALGHALAGALIGALLGSSPIWIWAWTRSHSPRGHFDWLTRVALDAYLDAYTLPFALVAAVVALTLGVRVRGRSVRSMGRRCVLAAVAASGFATPGLVGAFSSVRARVWIPFDHPPSRIATTPSPDGSRVLVHVTLSESGFPTELRWSSTFCVDTANGAVERLPAGREYHGYWIDDHTLAFHDSWRGETGAIYAFDLDTGRKWLHDANRYDGWSPWLEERVVGRSLGRVVYQYRLRQGAGSASEPVQGFALRSYGTERHFLLRDDERILEVFADGRPPSSEFDIEPRGSRRFLSVSPDGHWLRVIEKRESSEGDASQAQVLTLLFDLRSRQLVAEVEGMAWTWRRGPKPLVFSPGSLRASGAPPNSWTLAGPGGFESLPFGREVEMLEDLDGERWIRASIDGAVDVLTREGAHLITLRDPNRVSP